MNRRLISLALLGMVSLPARAHRIDEYLQATIFSIESGSLKTTMRLVPGVAVARDVIATIDSNHDGVLSNEEQHRYAQRVLTDLQVEEDDRRLPLYLLSATFPSVDLMKQGTGEIELTFSSELSVSRGEHLLKFANHHRSDISVYLVNSLVPQDKDLVLGTQSRNQSQSFYQVTFTQATGARSKGSIWSGFGGAFRLGARHIAEGTDHLLFLLTLLLPAPLLAFRGRWSGHTTIGRSLTHILGIVTAFTLGHSLTLALSGLGLVHLSSRPVEVLIAISILVSAIHAMRPIFPGRESIIAGFFGLIHGLAFASALNELGVTRLYRLVSLLGFNVGIEAMQLAVITMTLPALLVLSRTERYAAFRLTGAAFASVASCAWIAERVVDQPNSIGYGIETLAHHGVLLYAGLWVCSVVAWLSHQHVRSGPNESVTAVKSMDR
ncbi:HupE/UreJ family protein [Tunturiibacter lichenicola]|uniref:HupE/UreJ family protein n=1 Tax=Tunturiibacter lichenicola TaxID=2051959 RepID=UPI003D9B68A7